MLSMLYLKYNRQILKISFSYVPHFSDTLYVYTTLLLDTAKLKDTTKFYYLGWCEYKYKFEKLALNIL